MNYHFKLPLAHHPRYTLRNRYEYDKGAFIIEGIAAMSDKTDFSLEFPMGKVHCNLVLRNRVMSGARIIIADLIHIVSSGILGGSQRNEWRLAFGLCVLIADDHWLDGFELWCHFVIVEGIEYCGDGSTSSP